MPARSSWRLYGATPADIGFIARLRNDAVSARFSRRGVLDPARVEREFLATPRCHSFVCHFAEQPVGYARFDFESEAAEPAQPEISIALAPERRGTGLGVELVAAATDFGFANWDEPEVQGIIAVVHRENRASRRCFERAGYVGFEAVGVDFECGSKLRVE